MKWVGQVPAASWWGWENWGMKRLNDLFNVIQGIWDKVQCSLYYPLLWGTQRASKAGVITYCMPSKHRNTPGSSESHRREHFLGHGVIPKFLVLLSSLAGPGNSYHLLSPTHTQVMCQPLPVHTNSCWQISWKFQEMVKFNKLGT